MLGLKLPGLSLGSAEHVTGKTMTFFATATNGAGASAQKSGANASVDGSPFDDAVPLPETCAATCRRLRHVSQLAIRGLDFEACAPEGFMLEIAAARTVPHDSSCSENISEASQYVPEIITLERSDIFHTRNPTWIPVCDFQPMSRQLSAFELRASGCGQGGAVFWRFVVSLSALVLLCDDLEEAEPPPPCGVPLLCVGGRWHSMPSAGIKAIASRSKAPRRGAAVKQIQASIICGAGDRISSMLERLSVLQARSASLREEMATSLVRGERVNEMRKRRHEREQRVRQLQGEAQTRLRRVQQLRARLEDSHQRHSCQAERILECRGALDAKAQEEAAAVISLDSVYRQLRFFWRQRRCRQMWMVKEVCEVYPIETFGRCKTIRRLLLADIETLSRQDLREEESISTALGYLAHLLITLAGILEVPLRMRIHQAGCSRCSISDPYAENTASAQARSWPLYYGRGNEKTRFVTALHLLRDDLDQFLYSRGYFDERMHLLNSGNLLERVHLIIRKELHQPETIT